MTTFRTKPIEIEAVQWRGGNQREIETLAMEVFQFDNTHLRLLLETKHGVITLEKGDWLVKRPDGCVEPVAENEFAKTYEKV